MADRILPCPPSVAAGDYQWVETLLIGVPPNGQLAAADPDRVLLVISHVGGLITLCASTNPMTDPGNPQGYSFGDSNTPAVLRYRDFGPIVGVAWYLSSLAGTFTDVTVITVSYRPQHANTPIGGS